MSGKDDAPSGPWLLFVAHPDDETLGASAWLGRAPHVTVAYASFGAPRDPRLRAPGWERDRAGYARHRRAEALEALRVAGVPAARVHWLGAEDQRVVETLPRLVRALGAFLDAVRPEVLLTHAYEGGHPDHDACNVAAAWAVARVRALGGAAPSLFEFAGYHRAGGHRVTGSFHGDAGHVLALTAAERARKWQMRACHGSQAQVLAGFTVEDERIRVAAPSDYARPPHEGLLHYEAEGWAEGPRWRSAVEVARAACGCGPWP